MFLTNKFSFQPIQLPLFTAIKLSIKRENNFTYIKFKHQKIFQCTIYIGI